MILKNETVWSTDALRALVSAACKLDEFRVPDGAIVRVVYSRMHDQRWVDDPDGRHVLSLASGERKRGRWSATKPTYSGWAYFGAHNGRRGCAMLLRLPRPEHIANKLHLGQLAHLIRHEVGHWRGLHHKQMGGSLLAWSHTDDCPVPDWAQGLDVPAYVALPKVKQDRAACTATMVEKREARARRNLANAEHALSLAEARVDRWRRRVKYYERKAK